MDFAEPAAPQVRRQTFSPPPAWPVPVFCPYRGSHADLTGQYAAIPAEMKEVAACFDRQVLRQVPEDLFWARMGELRGTRLRPSASRAAHFFEEDRRTAAFEDALAQNDIPQILSLFAASGRSSNSFCKMPGRTPSPENEAFAWHWLYPAIFAGQRRLPDPRRRICREHPVFRAAGDGRLYRQRMEAVFGLGSCRQLYIRPAGAGKFCCSG